MSTRGKWSEWDDAALRALQEGGWPIETAAWYFERTENAVHQHARRLGISFSSHRIFTPDEDATIRINYPDLPTLVIAYVLECDLAAVYRRAYALGLEKSARFKRSKWAARWDPENPSAKAHRFPKGHVPANKGMRRPGYAPGRMAATQFKKGQMSGAAQHNYVPIGTERIKDGVLCRKVTDDPTMYPRPPLGARASHGLGSRPRPGARGARGAIQGRHEDPRRGADHHRPARARIAGREHAPQHHPPLSRGDQGRHAPGRPGEARCQEEEPQ